LAKRKLEADHERNHPEVQFGLELDRLCDITIDGTCRAEGLRFQVEKDSVYKNADIDAITFRDT